MAARPHVLLACLLACCGGKVIETVQDLPFNPQVRSAGYGYIGGMHVTLVDTTTEHVKRTLKIHAAQLQGVFNVAAGGAQVSLVETAAGASPKTYPAVSGSISIDPGASAGGLGSERVRVDIVLADPTTPAASCTSPGSTSPSSTTSGRAVPAPARRAHGRRRLCALPRRSS